MKKILIIGAGFLQSYVIRKAKEMGYITLAVDANEKALGFAYADEHAVINIVDEEACLAYAKDKQIDGVLTAATDYGVLTAAYIAEQMGLPGLRYESAKRIKNKYLVRKCLYENKIDDTEQAYLVDASTDVEALKEILRYPVMVKPCDGSGSRGANRVDEPCALAKACCVACDASLTHRAEIETFIVGQEYGVESLVVEGEVHVLGVMKKAMTAPPYYAELGHQIPSGLSLELEERVKECVKKAITALDLNFGSVNMDLLVTDTGKIYIVDIGARMGGNLIGSHIIPIGTGVDYMANMIRNAVGDAVDLSPVQLPQPIATRLLALSPGKVELLPDIEEIAKKQNVLIEHHLRVGDAINTYRTNLDGCGYIVATGNNAEKNAIQAWKMIDCGIVRQ